uniref:Uncharacterized protein n=1 Tax=Rhizophora mucronata TaxID=61149 RepID=A0A2P2NRR5_RHIMU
MEICLKADKFLSSR